MRPRTSRPRPRHQAVVMKKSLSFVHRCMTWNKAWKHGYEPMVTLDLDSNGLLQGSELSDIWVWVDADSDAKLAPSEVVRADSVIKSLSVRPIAGANYSTPNGAQLLNGNWVGSWDWWSITPSQSEANYVPQIDAGGNCTLFKWKQTARVPGQRGDLNEGYFLFGNLNGKLVLAAVSSLLSDKLTGSCNLVEVLPQHSLSWDFGEMHTVATFLQTGDLEGKSYLGGPNVFYPWSAVPVKSVENDFVASLSVISVPDLIGFLPGEAGKGMFDYRPVQKTDFIRPFKFMALDELVRDLSR